MRDVVPICLDCEHCELRALDERGAEGQRRINGKVALPVCTVAIDPITGAKGETAAIERGTGLCGPLGANFTAKRVESPPAAPIDVRTES